MASEHHLYIVGLGLIGGSVAYGLSGGNFRISGWDLDPEAREKALEEGLVDKLIAPEKLTEEVEGVMLAVPVFTMPEVVKKIKSSGHLPDYFTDVGSTKGWITGQMEKLLPETCRFIGAHPMAGSEKSGLKAADPLLFENAICVITCSRENTFVKRVKEIWTELGAHLMMMEPDIHDSVAARVSHLPHLAAAALVHSVTGLDDYAVKALPLAAGGFRDTTRIAGGDPTLWRDIFKTNRKKIVEVLSEFQNILNDVKLLLSESSWQEIIDWLSKARQERRRIPRKTKGIVGSLFELRIQAPDRPGILAEITAILAENEINICDIEVLRVREGEKGTIRLAFRRFEEQQQARKLLQKEAEGIITL
ncbi:MAG: prephenate dehydrogenase/arogenate dehydrogenase family protein [bacterium]